MKIHKANLVSWGNMQESEPRELFKGIIARTIWQASNHSKAMIVDFDPGAKWEGIDLHEPGPEEVYVISGVLNDGERDFDAGTFIHNPKGSSHVPQTTVGCRLFLFFPKG